MARPPGSSRSTRSLSCRRPSLSVAGAALGRATVRRARWGRCAGTPAARGASRRRHGAARLPCPARPPSPGLACPRPGRLQPPATCSASWRLGALGGGPGPCGARAQSGLRGGDCEAGRRSSGGPGAQHRAQAAGGGAGRGAREASAAARAAAWFTARRCASQPAALGWGWGRRWAGRVLLQPTCWRAAARGPLRDVPPTPPGAPPKSPPFLCDF